MDLKLGNIATEELATKPRQWKFEASLDRTIAGGHGNPSPVEISKFKVCSTGLRNIGSVQAIRVLCNHEMGRIMAEEDKHGNH